MTQLTRRIALTLPALLAAPPMARAQRGAITLIVPFAAGGNVDTVTRVIAPELSRRLDRQVVVENAPGAGGTIGTERVARALPDGNTFLIAVESTLAISPFVTPSAVRYDALRDFVPVHMIASLPMVLAGKPELAATTLDQLIAYARTQPQGLSYATSGTGTALHLFGELLRERTGMLLEHVPYRLSPQMTTDLLGNRIDLAILTMTVAGPVVRDGRVRCYGVSSPERHPALPDQPTFAEQPATRGLAMEVWQGVFAPARTDPAIVQRMTTAMAAVMADPAVQDRVRSIGQTPSRLAGDQLGAFLREEITRYETVVKANNIKAE